MGAATRHTRSRAGPRAEVDLVPERATVVTLRVIRGGLPSNTSIGMSIGWSPLPADGSTSRNCPSPVATPTTA